MEILADNRQTHASKEIISVWKMRQIKIFASSSSWTKILENSAGSLKFSTYSEFHCLLKYTQSLFKKK